MEASGTTTGIDSDKAIIKALKPKVLHKYEDCKIGNWFYYRDLETNKPQGPTKLVMRDNKKVFTIRNNKLISINTNIF